MGYRAVCTYPSGYSAFLLPQLYTGKGQVTGMFTRDSSVQVMWSESSGRGLLSVTERPVLSSQALYEDPEPDRLVLPVSFEAAPVTWKRPFEYLAEKVWLHTGTCNVLNLLCHRVLL